MMTILLSRSCGTLFFNLDLFQALKRRAAFSRP